MCSPTRASVQTGRTPRRDCIFGVEVHQLPASEFTLARAAAAKGYVSAHFGKVRRTVFRSASAFPGSTGLTVRVRTRQWHLGSLQKGDKSGPKWDPAVGDDGPLPQLSPLDVGYTEFVSTPQCGCSANTNCGCLQPGATPNMSACLTGHYAGDASHMVFPCQQYWIGAQPPSPEDPSAPQQHGALPPGQAITALEGKSPDDDASFLVDNFERFMGEALHATKPFVALVHFHNVHIPYVATPEFRAMYPDATSNEKDYYGALTMMDAQVGRIRALLRAHNIQNNTALWFAADNGPEVGAPPGQTYPTKGWPFFPDPGVTGGLRGRKRDLTEGGIRVPGLVEWPAVVGDGAARSVHWPAATFDYLPTLMSALGGVPSTNPSWPLDGIDLMPLLRGEVATRSAAAKATVHKGNAQVGAMGWEFKTPFGSTNALDKKKCPPASNSSMLLTPAVPPTAPDVPAAFAALQLAWVEDRWKLFGCRESGTEDWRLFLFDIDADSFDDPSSRDVLAQNRQRAVEMAHRCQAWQQSVQASQGPAETNCSAAWRHRAKTDDTRFVATLFSGAGYAAPSSGMLVATSSDGITFTNLATNSSSGAEPLYALPGGVRDPSLLRWGREGAEKWFAVMSFAANRSSQVFMAESDDLLRWQRLGKSGGGMLLAAPSRDNYVDVPQLIAGPDRLHIIGCVDGTHHWVGISAKLDAPWGDLSTWSSPAPLTDHTGAPLRQGNTFVARRPGTSEYYMAFDADESGNVSAGYFMRTSRDLSSGWSSPRKLAIDALVNDGDSESLVFLRNGDMRFYISAGSRGLRTDRKGMWSVDSSDGVTWSAPKQLRFRGFADGVNWAQVYALKSDDVAIRRRSSVLSPRLSEYSIVVCGNATVQEHDAAVEAQLWLSQLAGQNLTVHHSNESYCDHHPTPTGDAIVAVGPTAAMWCGLSASVLPELGLEGVHVAGGGKTGLAKGCVVATGSVGAPRGTLYAVSELMEQLGVRFLHEEETLLPANAAMPSELMRRFIPPLEYRATDEFTGTVTPAWTQRVRINSYGDWNTRWNFGKASGGTVRYAEGPPASNLTYPGFSHTAFNIVPVWLNSSHPEWFGGDPGTTVPPGGQLCWGDPSLIAFVTERVREFLRGPSKGSKIVSVSNNDAYHGAPWCTRKYDAAIIAEEESPMGPLLRAVNAVAEAIEPEFPDVAISTMAYQHTAKPPVKTRPRPNVIVRVCIGYNNSWSLGSAAEAGFLANDLAGWSKVSKRIYLWDYKALFSDLGFLSPYPIWHILAPNMRTLVGANSTFGVKGYFAEADLTNLHGDLQELNSYMIAQLAWDPERWTTEQLIDDFVPAFFGQPAAPFVKDYIEFMAGEVEKYGVGDSRNNHLGNVVGFCYDFLTPGTIIHAGAICKAAFGATALTPARNRFVDRVLRMQLPIYTALLGRWEEVWDAAHNPESPWYNPAGVSAC